MEKQKYYLVPIIILIFICNMGICQEPQKGKTDSATTTKRAFRNPSSYYGMQKGSWNVQQIDSSNAAVNGINARGVNNQEKKDSLSSPQASSNLKSKANVESDKKSNFRPIRITN